jgi:ribosomal protein S3
LALFYFNSSLLSNYLSFLIKNSDKHYVVLKNVVKVLQNFYLVSHIKLLGIQLRLSGKLGGKMRKSKYHYQLGKVQLQTLKSKLSYDLGNSYTKYGVISVKV